MTERKVREISPFFTGRHDGRTTSSIGDSSDGQVLVSENDTLRVTYRTLAIGSPIH